MATGKFPDLRLTRLRQNNSIRRILDQPVPAPEKFIWPVFVVEGSNKEIPIKSMPGQYRYSVDRLCKAIEPVAKMGIGGIMIFVALNDDRKSSDALYAFDEQGLAQRAIIEIKKHFPELVIFADVCICSYTDHGHCAILDCEGKINSDKTLETLTKVAVSYANCGAHVAPSSMMDGQIAAIRKGLADNNLNDTILMSYSTKFASAMYGPFREAADSAPGKGDRQGYQAMYGDGRRALLESVLDEDEGADILMVKPSLFYLDILAKIRETSLLPLAAYNVSGEYSMLIATADRGWGELYPMVRESTAALVRAGTDILISYWAKDYDKIWGISL